MKRQQEVGRGETGVGKSPQSCGYRQCLMCIYIPGTHSQSGPGNSSHEATVKHNQLIPGLRKPPQE